MDNKAGVTVVEGEMKSCEMKIGRSSWGWKD